VLLLTRLRIVLTSAASVATALVNLATGRGERHPVHLEVGDEAPDFTLTGSDGCVYRLRESRGRETVVLAWFPRAFTGGCTIQCSAMAASSPAIRALGARHYAISLDPPETMRDFAASLGIDYPILSDPDGAVARAYGVLGRTGFPGRTTFFIGSDGRILHIDRQVRLRDHGRDITDRLAGRATPRP
jgi:thioredoxin-dependent peroxiredoxin